MSKSRQWWIKSKMPAWPGKTCDKCGREIVLISADGTHYWQPREKAHQRNICEECFMVWSSEREAGFAAWREKAEKIKAAVNSWADQKPEEKNVEQLVIKQQEKPEHNMLTMKKMLPLADFVKANADKLAGKTLREIAALAQTEVGFTVTESNISTTFDALGIERKPKVETKSNATEKRLASLEARVLELERKLLASGGLAISA